MNIKNEFKYMKDLVLHILDQYPETRDNDTLLYLKCCEHLGAQTLDDLKKLNLNIITVHKSRQVIQNKLQLFRPSDEVSEVRSKRSVEIRDYMSRLA